MPQSWDMGQMLYFPSEGRHAEDFYARKIQRLRPGLNPQTWVPEASMLTTRPPKLSTPSKSVHWAVRVTSKALSKCHAQCLPKCWSQSGAGGSEKMQRVGLFLGKHDCCGCWKSNVHEKLDIHITSWFWRQSSGRNLPFLSANVKLAVLQSAVYRKVSAHTSEHLVSIGTKLQLFF